MVSYFFIFMNTPLIKYTYRQKFAVCNYEWEELQARWRATNVNYGLGLVCNNEVSFCGRTPRGRWGRWFSAPRQPARARHVRVSRRPGGPQHLGCMSTAARLTCSPRSFSAVQGQGRIYLPPTRSIPAAIFCPRWDISLGHHRRLVSHVPEKLWRNESYRSWVRSRYEWELYKALEINFEGGISWISS